MKKPLPYFPFIDGLRGVSILMVVAAHTVRYAGFGPAMKVSQFVKGVFFGGRHGVQLFFMLSAFVLFLRIKERLPYENNWRTRFYVRRAFRILPFWWLTITLYCIYLRRPITSAFPELFMYFGLVDRAGNVFDAQWSIFVEESFYLFLPFLFAWFCAVGKTWALVFAMYLAHLLWIKTGHSAESPVAQWFCFAIGILVCHFYLRAERFSNWVRANRGLVFVVDILLICLTLRTLSAAIRISSLTLALVFIASIFPQSIFGKLARTRFLGLFGRYAYSIYLLHLLVISALLPYQATFIRGLHLERAPVVVIYLSCFLSVASVMLLVGFICYRLIEYPCIQAGRSFLAQVSLRVKPI